LQDIYKLTPEQMKDIRTNLVDVWQDMTQNIGKYSDRTLEYWNKYTESAGELEELTKKINDNMTQTSFDSIRSEFQNALMGMSEDADDFGKDFKKVITNAILNAQIGNLLNDKLQKWYNSWAETMKNQNGSLTNEQITQETNELKDIYQSGMDIRDTTFKLTGYNGDDAASATKSTTVNASQNSVDEWNGRLTESNEIALQNKGISELSQAELKSLNLKTDTMIINVSGIHDTLKDSYAEIQGIHRDTTEITKIVKPISDIKISIDSMNEKLKKL